MSFQTNITSLSHDGRGISHINGKTTFIEGALPDEEIIGEYTKRHKKYDEARVTQILLSSPHRIKPGCIHFEICGGCNLQHLNPEQQILLKQNTLLEQLQHFGHIQPENILPPLTGPEWGYRHKARLSVKFVDKKQALLIGFHEKNGRYVANLTRCEILHPSVGLLIEPLKQLIQSLSVYKSIPQIEVAVDDQSPALIIRHMLDMPEIDRQQIINFAKHNNLKIFLQPNKPKELELLWPDDKNYLLSYKIIAENLSLQFQPTDFTQINPVINQKMIALALELLELNPSDKALDLFCGLGNFTLPIAKHCEKVIGIEGDSNMVKRAIENAKLNNITNAEFYSMNLAEPNLNQPWAQQKFDKILLDPPRTGALEIIKRFPEWQPKKIVYVSCNPATLARDAGELVQQGYRLHKAGVLDMFPHTKHVESIALFIRP